jgi:hypothetical protein
LATGRSAFSGGAAPALAQLTQDVVNGVRLAVPSDVNPILASMIKRCWMVDPTMRRTIGQIQKEFAAVKWQLLEGQEEADVARYLSVIAGKVTGEDGTGGSVGQLRKAALGPGEKVLMGKTDVHTAVRRRDGATIAKYTGNAQYLHAQDHDGKTPLLSAVELQRQRSTL